MIKIDKSKFTPEQLEQYNQLVAIGKADVDPEAAEKQMEGEKPDTDPKKTTEKAEVEEMEETKKSASPEMTAALERLETLEKSIAMKEYTEIAKKYASLGEKEEDLAKTLYEMKKSSPESYDAYIKVLDKSLDLVEKSGVFAEIGKSASGNATGAVEKIEAAANEIMKSDSTMTREQAVAKAWTDHPELIAEYDAEYKA